MGFQGEGMKVIKRIKGVLRASELSLLPLRSLISLLPPPSSTSPASSIRARTTCGSSRRIRACRAKPPRRIRSSSPAPTGRMPKSCTRRRRGRRTPRSSDSPVSSPARNSPRSGPRRGFMSSPASSRASGFRSLRQWRREFRAPARTTAPWARSRGTSRSPSIPRASTESPRRLRGSSMNPPRSARHG